VSTATASNSPSMVTAWHRARQVKRPQIVAVPRAQIGDEGAELSVPRVPTWSLHCGVPVPAAV